MQDETLKMKAQKLNYSDAILSAFDYLLTYHKDVFVLGQGLWSPWYVGNTMKDLDIKFGTDRIIDTPVSESACTGAALGASITGMRPIVVHPRMDFMLYAMDSIVNEAAKWSFMFGGNSNPKLTIRAILNRGGEQGAQHSQSLHSWFAHIPGLRVVMPSTVKDARDLLIASVLCNDPVIYIDDRWLYEKEEVLLPIKELNLINIHPQYLSKGNDITLVGAGYSASLALEASQKIVDANITCDVIDLRVINPFDSELICESVKKTGALIVIDGGWQTCGLSSEVIACLAEKISLDSLKSKPKRITLENTPAPTSSILEKYYYPNLDVVVKEIINIVGLK